MNELFHLASPLVPAVGTLLTDVPSPNAYRPTHHPEYCSKVQAQEGIPGAWQRSQVDSGPPVESPEMQQLLKMMECDGPTATLPTLPTLISCPVAPLAASQQPPGQGPARSGCQRRAHTWDAAVSPMLTSRDGQVREGALNPSAPPPIDTAASQVCLCLLLRSTLLMRCTLHFFWDVLSSASRQSARSDHWPGGFCCGCTAYLSGRRLSSVTRL